jgi:hypothetical protein
MWIDLAADARAIACARPTILEQRVSTRQWDAVYWLLSARRREGLSRDPDGLAEHAIFGAETLRCGAQSGIGIPLRIVGPERAGVIATYLATSMDRARADFDVPAMIASAVYKAPGEGDREATLELLGAYARLYRATAENGDCVLVSFD